MSSFKELNVRIKLLIFVYNNHQNTNKFNKNLKKVINYVNILWENVNYTITFVLNLYKIYCKKKYYMI